jgi:hypothetical protein
LIFLFEARESVLKIFAGSESLENNSLLDVKNEDDLRDLGNDLADIDHDISDDLTADIIEEIEDDTERETLGDDKISQELLNLIEKNDTITNLDGLGDNGDGALVPKTPERKTRLLPITPKATKKHINLPQTPAFKQGFRPLEPDINEIEDEDSDEMESLFGTPPPHEDGNLFSDNTNDVPPSSSPSSSFGLSKQLNSSLFAISQKDNGLQPILSSLIHSDLHISEDSSVPAEELVSTDLLMRFGLSYNVVYKLLICSSCGDGHRLGSIHMHLTDTKGRRSIYENGAYQTYLVDFQHDSAARTPPSNLRLQKIIVESLMADGHITDETEIRNENSVKSWIGVPLPTIPDGSPRPAVMGLKVYENALKCTICNKCTKSIPTMKTHFSNVHKESKPARNFWTSAAIQTLTEANGFNNYFDVEVDPSKNDLSINDAQSAEYIADTTSDGSSNEYIANIGHLLAKQKGAVMSYLSTTVENDPRKKFLFLTESGIEPFLENFDRAALRSNINEGRDSSAYKRLQYAIAESFKKDLKLMQENKIHHTVLTYVTNVGRNSDKMRRAFKPLLRPASVTGYVLEELRLIWAIFQFNGISVLPEKVGEEIVSPFQLDGDQKEAVKVLIKELLSSKFSITETQLALRSLFKVVYFPKNSSTSVNIFNSPIIAFMAIECLRNDGNYTDISLIPPILAKIQYFMRLRALDIVNGFDQSNSNDFLK